MLSNPDLRRRPERLRRLPEHRSALHQPRGRGSHSPDRPGVPY